MGDSDRRRRRLGLPHLTMLDEVPAGMFLAEILRLTVVEHPVVRFGARVLSRR